MLLTFEKSGGESITLGPLKTLRLDGEELRELQGGPVLARHEGHSWTVQGQSYLRLDYEGPVTIKFEDSRTGRTSATYGPFMHLSSVDGMTYLNHELFCQLNSETHLWYFRQENTEWPTVLIEKP
jgi:hypothetical protein